MDAYKGVTIMDYACAAGCMGAGMTEEQVCEILGISVEDWTEARQYWAANSGTFLAENPKMVTTYTGWFQNPQQGKFAGFDNKTRSLEELLKHVPNVDTFVAIRTQTEECTGSMNDLLAGYGLTLAEWSRVSQHWGAIKPKEDVVIKVKLTRENCGVTEDNLEYFEKTDPGVYALKKVRGWDIVKTVIDQNQRTVSGVIQSKSPFKTKMTVSFDEFSEFCRVTLKKKQLNTGVSYDYGYRLEMHFLVDGSSQGMTLLTMPDELGMPRVINEIRYIMDVF